MDHPVFFYLIGASAFTLYGVVMCLLFRPKQKTHVFGKLEFFHLEEIKRLRADLSEAWAINDQLTHAARNSRSLAFQEAAAIIQGQIDVLGDGHSYPYSRMERDQVAPYLEPLLDEFNELGSEAALGKPKKGDPVKLLHGTPLAKPYRPGAERSAYDGRTLYEQARIYMAAMGMDAQHAHRAANRHIEAYGNERLPPECLDVVVGIMMGPWRE